MPYRTIADLPTEQVDTYNDKQKHAFLEAFNRAENEGEDESTAFAIAHTAAKKATGNGGKKQRSEGKRKGREEDEPSRGGGRGGVGTRRHNV